MLCDQERESWMPGRFNTTRTWTGSDEVSSELALLVHPVFKIRTLSIKSLWPLVCLSNYAFPLLLGTYS